MSISATFDQLLRGGRVICPASGIDGIRDVAIRNGKIAAVQSDILPTSAREVIDVTGKLVLPGLIDTHAHVYQYVTGRFGMDADMVRRAVRRDDVGRSGRAVLHDAAGFPRISSPSRRSRASMPSCRPTWSAGWKAITIRKLYSPDGVDVDATVKAATRQSRHCSRHQGPCRDRRLRALGHSTSSKWRPRSDAAPTCRSMSISASSGACPKAAPTAKTPIRSWSA